MHRRRFLKLAGTAGAAVAAGGCRQGGPEHLVPYLVPPGDDVQPGVTAVYATVCRECPAGCGMLARVRDGRAFKLEGNPEHPINRGKLCIRGQAALQGLYNPDRIPQPLARAGRAGARPISWPDAERQFDEAITRAGGGRALWIGELHTGALDRLIDSWLTAFLPGAVRVRYEPFAYEPLRAAAGRVLGAAGIPEFNIAAAHTLVSFGADFLETWVSNVQYAREFGEWRAARAAGMHRGRFVFISPHLTLTGANADEWIRIRPGSEAAVARALAGVVAGGGDVSAAAAQAGVEPEVLQRLGGEIAASPPSLVLPLGVGGYDAAATAAEEAILRLNVAAGSVGRTILTGRPHALSSANGPGDLLALVPAMEAGDISILFVEGSNPVYNLPPAARFAAALSRVPAVVSFSSYDDETSQFATLTLPNNTFLESWGEYSPRPGITGFVQPVVGPVFDTRQVADVLLASAARLGRPIGPSPFGEYHRRSRSLDAPAWVAALQLGGIFTQAGAVPGGIGRAGTGRPIPASPPAAGAGAVTPAAGAVAALVTPGPTPPPGGTTPEGPETGGQPPARQIGPRTELSLRVYPSLHFYDGRLANRSWCQEIGQPMSRGVWGSWVEIHPDTARNLGAADGDVLRLETDAGRLDVPALLTDRAHPEVVALQIGQGHRAYGRYADGSGVNAHVLLPAAGERPSGAPIYSGVPVRVSRLPLRRPLVILQATREQHGADVARGITLAQAADAAAGHPEESPALRPPRPSLYANHPHPKHHWGMVIDLDRCIGCNACAAACYSENNLAVAGREQCAWGREMAWLWIENYVGPDQRIEATGAMPIDMRFLPMLCQHCSNAPCEFVCPVNATFHDLEGLNEQVYNRCVGTRYCSNNCPYKVRRFNWFSFRWPPPLNRQFNPDVIRRTKGVMEKCTFCIQRIRAAEIQAKMENRPLRDGEIQTACMQTCPTEAITFGDFNDPDSRVRRLAETGRGYGALAHLNTYPNIVYLARIRAT